MRAVRRGRVRSIKNVPYEIPVLEEMRRKKNEKSPGTIIITRRKSDRARPRPVVRPNESARRPV